MNGNTPKVRDEFNVTYRLGIRPSHNNMKIESHVCDSTGQVGGKARCKDDRDYLLTGIREIQY